MKKKPSNIPLISAISAVIFTLMFLYFFYLPPGSDIGPEQPIPFSHRVHTGVKNIQCEFCHPYVAQSSFPGLPPVEKCLYCHNYIIANHPWIKKEHEYFDTNTPTPWQKVNYVAEHVFFNHQRHIKKEIECEQCHGEVEKMDRLMAEPFRMGFCIECHREKNANLDCWLACHN
ncbi:MAG: cytochrome c3 family protein [Desulfobacterales bacterium]